MAYKYYPKDYDEEVGFETEIQERLFRMLDALCRRDEVPNMRQFELSIGASESWTRNFKGEKISQDRLRRISEAYPSINIEWLVTGEGDMFKNTPNPLPPTVSIRNDKSKNSGNINLGHDQIIGEHIEQPSSITFDGLKEYVDKITRERDELRVKVEYQRTQLERSEAEIKRLSDHNKDLMELLKLFKQ